MKSAACQQYLEERCSSSKGQAQVIDISEKQAAYPPKIGSLLHSHTQDEYPAEGERINHARNQILDHLISLIMIPFPIPLSMNPSKILILRLQEMLQSVGMPV